MRESVSERERERVREQTRERERERARLPEEPDSQKSKRVRRE